MRLNSKSGFTLIEILITLAIIGMLASLGAPALSSVFKRTQRNTDCITLDSLNTALELLKLKAEKECSIFNGNHSQAHYLKVFEAIEQSGYAEISAIDCQDLDSQGKGESFCFTRYRGAKVTNTEALSSKHLSSRKGIKKVPYQKAWERKASETPATIETPSKLRPPTLSPEAIEEIVNIIHRR